MFGSKHTVAIWGVGVFILCTRFLSFANGQMFRLVGGQVASIGLVEVYHDGVWGSVCDNGFGQNEADMICRSIGYAGADPYICCATNAYGSGEIWLDNLQCDSAAADISNCEHNVWGQHDCDHTNDIGIVCDDTTSTLTDPDVRLIDVDVGLDGLLEIYYAGFWGTVCEIGNGVADMLCKQMGYDRAESVVKQGGGQGLIWRIPVDCPSGASNLGHCQPSEPDWFWCNHDDDIAIACQVETTLADTATDPRSSQDLHSTYTVHQLGTIGQDVATTTQNTAAVHSAGTTTELATTGDTLDQEATGQTTVDSGETQPILSTTILTLAYAGEFRYQCSPFAPDVAMSSSLESLVADTLLDMNESTCLNPYEGRDQFQVTLDAAVPVGLMEFVVELVGHEMHCLEPSTIVFFDLPNQICDGRSGVVTRKQCYPEDMLYDVASSSCRFSCRSPVGCENTVRISLKLTRIKWLASGLALTRICDVKTVI